MTSIRKEKAQQMLKQIMELEKEFERDDSIPNSAMETKVKKIVEDVLNAIEID